MNINIFTKKAVTLKKAFPKNVQFHDLESISKLSLPDDSILYIDVTGLTPAKLVATLTQFKKACKKKSWGVVDPAGIIKDPAALFFDNACDYLGPVYFKKPKNIDIKRLKKPLQWCKSTAVGSNAKSIKIEENIELLKNGLKLPAANIFPGWKKIQAGKVMPFYLLFCSLQGKTAFDSSLGEKKFNQIHKRFLTLINNNLMEAEAQFWMDTGKDGLFLLPPRAKSAEKAVEACIRMIINAPLITLETLGLSIPLTIKFALHYGSINYRPPGRTGTVVSDAINYIFHLSEKRAEAGRLTISGDLPKVSIPKVLQDLFVPSGEYEGRKIWQTKKFSYAKPWV